MVVPTVSTQAAGSITATGATLNGTMVNKQGLAITAEGFEIGTTTGYSLGYFSAGTANLANAATFNLAKGSLANFTLYHYRARCTNSTGNGFGGDQTFTTLAVAPTMTMNAQSSAGISISVMHSYVYCSANGGQNPTAAGTVWMVGAGTPTLANSSNNIGAIVAATQYDSYPSGLSANTSYSFRAYGTNSGGTGYSAVQQRTTLNWIAPTTDPFLGAGGFSASGGGDIFCDNATVYDDGSQNNDTTAIDDYGVVYANAALNTTPTVGGSFCAKAQIGTSYLGLWDQTVTLAPVTTFKIRTYAHSPLGGYGYGSIATITTGVIPPTVVVYATYSDNHSITTYWEMTNNGGENPTGVSGMTLDTLTNRIRSSATYHTDITFPGVNVPVLCQTVTSLPSGTTHYTRAYSSNSAGVVYSADSAITTTSYTASVTTNVATSITPTQATLSGVVNSTYGSSIIESGVVYSTNINPTTSDTKVGVGSGTNPSGIASGLNPKTNYHCRAYCITDMGTAYGADQAFTTLSKVKNFNGINYSSIKTFNGKPIAQVKSIQSVQ